MSNNGEPDARPPGSSAQRDIEDKTTGTSGPATSMSAAMRVLAWTAAGVFVAGVLAAGLLAFRVWIEHHPASIDAAAGPVGVALMIGAVLVFLGACHASDDPQLYLLPLIVFLVIGFSVGDHLIHPGRSAAKMPLFGAISGAVGGALLWGWVAAIVGFDCLSDHCAGRADANQDRSRCRPRAGEGSNG